MKHSIEKYQLHAYLDGELSREEVKEVELALDQDPELRKTLERYSLLKHNIKKAYSDIPVEQPTAKTSARTPTYKQRWFAPKTAAASLFLGLVLGAGIYKYSFESSFNQEVIQQQQAKFLVHLDSSDFAKQQLALDKIEELFTNKDITTQVDLVSNYHGVELLDINNPNNFELQAMLQRYPNLTVYACERALERAKAKGEPLELMQNVKKDRPAIDRLAERLNSGWNYIKI